MLAELEQPGLGCQQHVAGSNPGADGKGGLDGHPGDRDQLQPDSGHTVTTTFPAA